MVPPELLAIVQRLLEVFGPLESPWAFTGSLGLALQGLETKIHDIDVQTDEAGAYRMQDLLGEAIEEPVSFKQSERIRSHFGRGRLAGYQIEIMGDIQKMTPLGEWQDPPELERIIRRIVVQGLQIPVLDLIHEKEAYRALGRHERAEEIGLAIDLRSAADQKTD